MKKIVFLTGTRADFGKIKSLLKQLEEHADFEVYVCVTGMHLQDRYGYTLIEIQRCQFTHIHTFENHTHESTMDLTLAKTIEGFSAYCKTLQPDLIVVHGDRVETLAGAIVGALNNFLVAHIEGGELSGTVDELIRHSVSKLSHLHFVSNAEAAKRLLQMGEEDETIFEIGSPDLDIMFSDQLPQIETVKAYYEIPFESYAIVLFHPVTTELDYMENHAQQLVGRYCMIHEIMWWCTPTMTWAIIIFSKPTKPCIIIHVLGCFPPCVLNTFYNCSNMLSALLGIAAPESARRQAMGFQQ